MKGKNRIIGILLMIIGVVVCIFSGIARHQKLVAIEQNYSRPNNSYYHYSDFYGYFEVKTNASIDVDNCFVNIYNTFFNRNDRVKLQYEGVDNGFYVFKINEGPDYTINSIEIVDFDGNIIELTKYSEMQELERRAAWDNALDKANGYIFVFVLGIAAIIVGIIVFFKDKIFMPKSMAHIKKTPSGICKYCGTKNRLDEVRCPSCGANLKH